MRPALVVLAAGLASRFGRPKQLEPVGPAGECLMDYGILDAVRSGFGHVIVVVHPEHEASFVRHLEAYRHWLEFDTACQDIRALPGHRTAPPGRSKPWGTAHAVLAAAPLVDSPFAVMNADDFYGRASFTMLGATALALEPATAAGANITFPVAATLSPNGGVSRAVCELNAEGRLRHIVEHVNVRSDDGDTICATIAGAQVRLAAGTPVSMNLWMLTEAVLGQIETGFAGFLDEQPGAAAEYLLPDAVNTCIAAGELRIDVARSPAEWFGLTFPEDRANVVARIAALVSKGEYPPNLKDAG